MSPSVRVRYAPSPTGYLHVGGARTALFNYLFARHHRGTFILRIEDTDRNRFVEGALNEIYESLRWLGLEWDEGPEVGGEYGPYIQSERLQIYKKQAEELLSTGNAYRCFCTPQRLEQVRLAQEKAKSPTGYDRHCRKLSKQESDAMAAEGKPFIIRMKIPKDTTVAFDDLIRGRIEYSSNVLDDLVLLKSDGFPTYHLANVVDDHFMAISHVMRGDEWIASTPRHVLLYQAFGWTPPVFAHLPIILDPSGGKLSKRKGAASVMDFKRAGYLPEALFNFLAFLGWSPGAGDEREKMSREELISAFSLDKVSPKSAVFDEKKLEWMNGLYLTDRTIESIIPDVYALWKQKGIVPAERQMNDPLVQDAIRLLKDRSKRLTEIAESGAYFFADPSAYDEQAAKKHFKPESLPILKTLAGKMMQLSIFDHASIEGVYRDYAEKSGLSAGNLIHPTRLAVSGVSYGPGLFELLEVLGKETVLRRMNAAVAWMEKASR
jgi:glutamyl-tRNA synthetase